MQRHEGYPDTVTRENLNAKGRRRFYLRSIYDGIDFRGKKFLDIGGGIGVHSFYAASKDAILVVCDCSNSNFFARLNISNPFAPAIEWQKHQRPEVWSFCYARRVS